MSETPKSSLSPADKPAAWFEFADNGHIIFWTRDPNQAVVRWGIHAPDYALYRHPPASDAEALLRSFADDVRMRMCVVDTSLGVIGALDKCIEGAIRARKGEAG